MKLRIGFVSNSSSCSFLVKCGNKINKKGKVDILPSEIFNLIEVHLNNFNDRCEVKEDKDSIIEEIAGFDCATQEQKAKELEKIYKKLKKGENIVYITLDKHVPVIRYLIWDNKNIKVLKEWEG